MQTVGEVPFLLITIVTFALINFGILDLGEINLAFSIFKTFLTTFGKPS